MKSGTTKDHIKLASTAMVTLVLLSVLTASAVTASSDPETPRLELISEEDDGAHGEEFWWKFPGWEVVFAVLSCIYFLTVITLLPKAIQLKTGRRDH